MEFPIPSHYTQTPNRRKSTSSKHPSTKKRKTIPKNAKTAQTHHTKNHNHPLQRYTPTEALEQAIKPLVKKPGLDFKKQMFNQ